MRDTGAGGAELGDVAVRKVHAVREPYVVAEPAERFDVVDRTGAEVGEAELLLVGGLGEVGVQADAERARQLRAIAHELAGDRERRAGCERDLQQRVEARVVVSGDRGLALGQDPIGILDHLVGRQAAGRAAQVHRAAGGAEAQPDAPRRLDLGAEQIAG